MPCKPASYVGAVADAVRESNLNGQVSYTAARRWQPAPDGSAGASSGLSALVFAVAQTTEEGRRLTPQGSRWSSMNLVQPDDGALSLRDLDRRLDHVIGPQGAALNDTWRARQFDAAGTQRLIHVEAGMEVGALCELLDTNPGEPWALPTLGGANGQTLAGVISTSTHGGDWQQPPFPDLVRALHLVTDGGRELWIEPARAPVTDDVRLRAVLPCADTEIIRSDEVFDAALVSFGRFGVIYAVILEVTLGFNVAEVITLMPSGPLLQAMGDGARAANPLAPLFALAASTPLPATLQVRDEVLAAGDPMFFQLVYSSQDPTQAWVERRWPTANATPLHLPTGPDMTALQQAFIGIHLLNLAWTLGIDVAPFVNRQFADRFAPAMTDGLRGPHHLITSGTRLASHLPLAIGDSIEVVFDARNPNGVAFLRNVLALAPTYKQAGWISARPAQRSRATLSMHNLDTDLTWSIEITTIESAPDRAAWMNQVQDLALSHGGRPHWGQHNAIDATHVWHLYGKRMQHWHQALWRVSRDSATFSSDFTRRRGLDPTHVREVRAAFRTPSGALTHLVGPDGADWSPVSVRDVMQEHPQRPGHVCDQEHRRPPRLPRGGLQPAHRRPLSAYRGRRPSRRQSRSPAGCHRHRTADRGRRGIRRPGRAAQHPRRHAGAHAHHPVQRRHERLGARPGGARQCSGRGPPGRTGCPVAVDLADAAGALHLRHPGRCGEHARDAALPPAGERPALRFGERPGDDRLHRSRRAGGLQAHPAAHRGPGA